jgi:hypothetical protein
LDIKFHPRLRWPTLRNSRRFANKAAAAPQWRIRDWSAGRNLPKPPSPIIVRLYHFWLLPLSHAQQKSSRYFRGARRPYPRAGARRMTSIEVPESLCPIHVCVANHCHFRRLRAWHIAGDGRRWTPGLAFRGEGSRNAYFRLLAPRRARIRAAHPDDLPTATASANLCALTSWSIRCDIGARSPLCPA